MIVHWFAAHPTAAGVVTTILMWTDWALTIAQEREHKKVHEKHYEVYPASVSEGNPLLQAAVAKRAWFNPFHFSISI